MRFCILCNNNFLILKSAIVVLCFVFPGFSLMAQNSINSSGGTANGSEANINYSVGQTFFQTSFDINGSVSEGVQQPYEISVVSLQDNESITLTFNAYPNPVDDQLKLIFTGNSYSFDNTNYQLFDLKGELFETRKISSNETIINMSHLSSGVYLIKVYDSNNEIIIFKVIKR